MRTRQYPNLSFRRTTNTKGGSMIEVYVVLEMANGYIEDISVHRKEPIGLTPIDEFGDNGHYLFHLPIEEDA